MSGHRSWWLTALATVTVALSKLLLMRFRTTTVLRVLAGGPRLRAEPAIDASSAASSVGVAARALRADCLPQATALAALLQRAGAAPTVVLGCRLYSPGKWGAHAWVEVDGQRFDPLIEAEHAELARLTAARGWRVEGA